jgi:hypothetical protein
MKYVWYCTAILERLRLSNLGINAYSEFSHCCGHTDPPKNPTGRTIARSKTQKERGGGSEMNGVQGEHIGKSRDKRHNWHVGWG